jgi:seryl-tRNA synthetase
LNRKAQLPNDAVTSAARAYIEWKRISGDLNAKRNARAAVGERIRRSNSDEEREAAILEASTLKAEVKELEATLDKAEQQCLHFALPIPNDTHPKVPLGPATAAVTISTHDRGLIPHDPKRDHLRISKHFGLVDLESASNVTGNSWYFLRNEAAILELALTNYAISIAIQHGFTPVTTPDVVRSDISVRCGFNPRDNSNPPVSHMYHLSSTNPFSPELVLSGTSEVPLAGMFANKIYSSSDFPLRFVGVGHAFRAEAGARSVDTRGLYRVHQFTKVELFAVTAHDASENMMEEMVSIQKSILEGLGLSFRFNFCFHILHLILINHVHRVLDMPTEELGASAYRKYDIEAWMPGRGSWGEVTSLSNCTDYQARRLHIRYRPQGGAADSSLTRLPFAHTLNGTAAAIPRLIIALLENGTLFNEQGNPIALLLPAVLRPFWIPVKGRDFVQWSDI